MASLKALTVNLIETATLKNGTGGGAPALSEVSPYTTTKAQDHSRRSYWQKASAAALDVDFDLGAAYTIEAGGLAGMIGISGAGVTSFTMKSQTGVYTPGGVWTDIPGRIAVDPSTGVRLASNSYDDVRTFSSAVSNVRSVRFSLNTVPTVFTLATFVVGAIAYDLGFLYSSLQAEPRTPQFADRGVDGLQIVNYVGLDRESWSLSWDAITSTAQTKLEALRALRSSFWLFDKNGLGREFIVQDSTLSRNHSFEQTSETIYDTSMQLEQIA